MLRKHHKNLPFFEFEIFRPHGDILGHAVFSRHLDVTNGQLVQEIMGSKNPPVSFQKQLHGTDLFVVDGPEFNQKGDAMITKMGQIPLVIRTADCASVILFEPQKRVIANIHAGWRGISQKIIHKTIGQLADEFKVKSENLLVAISPMIGPCCCRFSDPQKELPKFMRRYITEENTVNLWGAVEGHLRECGIPERNIENPRVCTCCNPEDFHSYRRDGTAGRFGTIVMLR
ncbi:laccase domain-containing protein [Candidatus Peregrinibacteria bacterium]|nr:laccase domain-containing protein [Candidatus Peregrinibacteria bacterium]